MNEIITACTEYLNLRKQNKVVDYAMIEKVTDRINDSLDKILSNDTTFNTGIVPPQFEVFHEPVEQLSKTIGEVFFESTINRPVDQLFNKPMFKTTDINSLIGSNIVLQETGFQEKKADTSAAFKEAGYSEDDVEPIQGPVANSNVSVILSSSSTEMNSKMIVDIIAALDFKLYEHNIYLFDSKMYDRSFLFSSSEIPTYMKYVIGFDETIISKAFARTAPGILVFYNCAKYDGVMNTILSNKHNSNKVIIIVDKVNPPITLIPYIDYLYLIDVNNEQLKDVYRKYPLKCSYDTLNELYNTHGELLYTIETGEIFCL